MMQVYQHTHRRTPLSQFVEVSPELRPEKHSRGTRQPSELSLALAEGKTVFLPGAKNTSVGHPKSYLRQRGYTVIKRVGEYKGKIGLYVWAEKPE